MASTKNPRLRFGLVALVLCALPRLAPAQDGDGGGWGGVAPRSNATDWLGCASPQSGTGGWNGAAVTDNTANCIGPFDWIGRCCPPLLYRSPYQTTYVTVDAVAFTRDWDINQTFATLGNPTTPVLSTHDLPFVYQPGMRVLVGRRFTDCAAIEASFLGLFRWDQIRAVQNENLNPLGTEGNLYSPFTQFGDPAEVGFDYNYFASIRVVSDFNNAEINLRYLLPTVPTCLQATVLAGFRYINVDEQFRYRTESLEPVAGGTLNTASVTTRNDLFGIQAGGAVEFQFEPRFWLNLEAKFLLMRNGASQDTVYNNGPLAGPATTITGSHSQGRATLGTDLAITGLWQPCPALVFRIGYQGVFLDGLALASENFTRNAPLMAVDPTELDYEGHLAFHGPFAGMTVTW